MNADQKNTDSTRAEEPCSRCGAPWGAGDFRDPHQHELTLLHYINGLEHELALVLNLMVDISCYSNDLPGPLAKALDKVLEEHTALCITEHHNDYGQCVKAGCPVYERGGK